MYIVTYLWCSYEPPSTFALLPFGQRCESEKIRRLKYKGAKAKERKCEVARTKREDAKVKVRKCKGKGECYYRCFALVTNLHSPLLTFVLFGFFCFVAYMQFDTGIVLALGLPYALGCYWHACSRQCGDHCAYYKVH